MVAYVVATRSGNQEWQLPNHSKGLRAISNKDIIVQREPNMDITNSFAEAVAVIKVLALTDRAGALRRIFDAGTLFPFSVGWLLDLGRGSCHARIALGRKKPVI